MGRGLQKQAAVIPILGLDSSADSKSAPPGTCDIIENMWFKRTAAGGGELRKRFGVTARSTGILTGGSVTVGKKLASRGDEQLVDNGTSLMSWSPTMSKWSQRVGVVPQVGVTAESISQDKRISTGVIDMAVGGGLLCVVYASPGGGSGSDAHVTIVDLATGAHVLDSAVGFAVASATVVRVVALSSVFMIVSSFLLSGTISSRTIAYATPTTISATVNVTTTLNSTFQASFWDMVRNGANDSVLLAYRSTVPDLQILIWNANQTNGGTVVKAEVPDQGLCWLSWDFSDNNGYLSYITSASGGLKTLTVAQAGPAISATTVNDAAVVVGRGMAGYRLGATNNIFVSANSGTNTANEFLQRSTGGAVATYLRGHNLATRAFVRAGRAYLGVTFDNSTSQTNFPTGYEFADQRTYFLLDVTTTTPFTAIVVAKALRGEGGGAAVSRSPGACPVIDSNTIAYPARRLSGGTGYVATLLRMDFSRAGFSKAVEIGGLLYLPGGVVRCYDGDQCVEAGFHEFGDVTGITPAIASNGVGTLTSSSTYQITGIYTWINSRGVVERSAPTPPYSIILGATDDTITADFMPLRLTEKASGVQIEAYCTVANGSTFYLEGTVANDVTVDTISFVFAGPDSFRLTQREIYNSGNELPHEPFPPARLLCSWGNRLFLAGTENSTQLWVSDELLPGEGVGVSGANAITMEQEGGAISALAEMDDRLIVGKSSGTNESTYELTGRGPAPNGEGPFEQPARITAVVGPTGPDAVVKTPQGLIFKSRRGFYLLPIGGALPIRLRGVEAFESLIFTGAVVLEDVEQVRFMTSTGTTLVYHFGFLDERGIGRWSTFIGQAAVDCAVWGGKFVYLESGGTVQEENGGFADNGAVISYQVRFAWLNLAALFGRLRLYDVQLLMDYMAANFFIIFDLAYDFDDTGIRIAPEINKSIQVFAGASATPTCLSPRYERATAIHVTVRGTTSNEAFRLSALGLEIGLKGGAGKYPGAQFMT